eukprot:CAMPEP_0170405342 /NCGR_PEP_ID=MMETSP0117_2-20130122/27126_1 /TAXON_ID=400756 /ORGANISM="Durinskia baltica, Strain CSIRO CS-38" /LENGTH=34 /DNA_ID= /DNA_START= /DNA_END= /DNA_ORIENTATION=
MAPRRACLPGQKVKLSGPSSTGGGPSAASEQPLN